MVSHNLKSDDFRKTPCISCIYDVRVVIVINIIIFHTHACVPSDDTHAPSHQRTLTRTWPTRVGDTDQKGRLIDTYDVVLVYYYIIIPVNIRVMQVCVGAAHRRTVYTILI